MVSLCAHVLLINDKIACRSTTMKHIIIVLAFLAVALTTISAEVGKNPASIATIKRVSLRALNPFGVVEGIVLCGGQGSLLQARVTDCTRTPCDLVTGGLYNIEFDFRPAQSHPGLQLKVMFHWHSEAYNVVEGPVADSAVEAGGAYTLTYPLRALGFIQGHTSFRIEIKGQNGEFVEVCGIIGTDIIPS